MACLYGRCAAHLAWRYSNSGVTRFGMALHSGLTDRRGSQGLAVQLHSHNLGLGTSTLPNTVRIPIDRLSLCASTEPQRQRAASPLIQPAAWCATSLD